MKKSLKNGSMQKFNNKSPIINSNNLKNNSMKNQSKNNKPLLKIKILKN